MLFKQVLKLGTLILLGAYVSTNSGNASQVGSASPTMTPHEYEFEYQESYNGIVLTMKDDMIAQLKNTMLSAVLDQEFMQKLLSNYWSIKPSESSIERKETMKEFTQHTS